MAARKKKAPERDLQKNTADYYDLHSKAIDDLVNADETNSPPVSELEKRKYKGSRFHLPNTFKVIFIKFWFPAAICFFIMWGLGTFEALDTLVILSLVSGTVTDLLTNGILRFIAPKKKGNNKWMMVPFESKLISLPLNILYAALLIFLVYSLYNAINTAAIQANGLPANTVTLGVEPILFGLFYLIIDLVFLWVRNMFSRIFSDARARVDGQR